MNHIFKLAWLFVFLTTFVGANADVYISGSDINGTYWDPGAEDAKMTEKISGVYVWEGETLGREFKFTRGTWETGFFPGTIIIADVGAKSTEDRLNLGVAFEIYASKESYNITMADDIARVLNPKVTLDLNQMTVTVTGEKVIYDIPPVYDPFEYSLYSLFINDNNSNSSELYPTELVSAADNSYLVRNVNLKGPGYFDLEQPDRANFFGYQVVKMDVVNDEKPETMLHLAEEEEPDPFNPQGRGLTYRNYDFNGIYDVEITYDGVEASVKFVKKNAEEENPNEIEDLVYVNIFGNFGGQEVTGYVDEIINDHTLLYRNLKITGDGYFYIQDTKSGLRFGGPIGGSEGISNSNLSITLRANSTEVVPVNSLDGYYDVTVVFNDSYTSATVTFNNGVAPEYATYEGDLYIVGAGNGWQLADQAYKLTCINPGLYEWTGDELQSDFKINGGSWESFIPGTNARLDFGGEYDNPIYPDMAYQVLVRGVNLKFPEDLSTLHNVKLSLNLRKMELFIEADEHIAPPITTATINVYQTGDEGTAYKAEVYDNGLVFKNVQFEGESYISLYYDDHTFGYANAPTPEQTITAANPETTLVSNASLPHYPYAVSVSLNGTYSVYVVFSEDFKTATLRVEPTETTGYPEKLYLVGTMNDWTLPSYGNVLEIPAVSEGVYSTTIDIEESYNGAPIAFKVFNTPASDWMDAGTYYGAMYPDNYSNIFKDFPASWKLVPGYGSNDMIIPNVTSLNNAVITVNLKENTMTIACQEAPEAPRQLDMINGGIDGAKYSLKREGDSSIFKGSFSIPKGSMNLTFIGDEDFRLGANNHTYYIWEDKKDAYTMMDSEQPLTFGNWAGGQLDVSVNITNNVVFFEAPEQPSYPSSIYLVMKGNGEERSFEIPSFESDFGYITFSYTIEDWQKDVICYLNVPGIGSLFTNSEPVEVMKDINYYFELSKDYSNNIEVSNWMGGTLSVFVPQDFSYTYLSSPTQPIKEQTLYLIGSPQGWNINNGSMELTQTDYNKFVGAFEMPEEPIFRFYSELGDWDSYSWGSRYDDIPVDVILTNDEELKMPVNFGKGSWNFVGFPGGMMYMEVDLNTYEAIFSTKPTSNVEAVEEVIINVSSIEGGIKVAAPQGYETVVYDLQGRIVGTGNGSFTISLLPGIYIANKQKVVVK